MAGSNFRSLLSWLRLGRRLGGARYRHHVVGVLVIVLVLFSAGLFQWQLLEHEREERVLLIGQTEQRATQLAGAVAERISLLLRSVDFALLQVRPDYGVNQARFLESSAILMRSFPEGALLQLSVANAQGDLTYSSLGMSVPVNIGDREHFKAHLDGSDRLFISKPLLGRVSKQWSIQFSRPLLRDGRFAGVVVISISPQYISQLLASFNLGPLDGVILFDGDGQFYARNRGIEELIGKTLAPARPFMAPDAAPQGIYRNHSFYDGLDRSLAWQRVPTSKLVAVVGIDMNTVLAPLEVRFKREQIESALLSALQLAMGGGVLALLALLSRRQKEHAASEARFRSLTELSSDWVWEQDRELRLTYDSAGFEPGSGVSSASLLGKRRWEEPGRTPLSGTWDEHRALLEARQPFQDFESVRVGADGKRHFVSISGEPMFDIDGNFTGYRGVGRNITERKQAEAALAANQLLFTTLLRNLSGYVYRCRNDADWTLQFISEGCLEITGYKSDELLENRVTSFGAIMFPDDVQAVWDQCQISLAAHKACNNEYRIVHRDGSIRWVWDQAQGVYSQSGELLVIDGLITDITERKRTEEELQRQDQRIKIAQSAARMVIVDWHIAQDRIEFSASPEWLRGPAPADGAGYPLLRDQVHPDDRSRFFAARTLAVETLQSQQVEFRVVRTDGQVLWVRAHQHVLGNAQGKAERVLSALTDISAQKRAEQDREQLESQLRQAQKMEALGTLAGGIAHDFNNILAAILGNVTLAREDAGAGHPAQVSLDEIAKAGRRARDLVQQILAFSRQQPQQMRPVELREVAQEAVKLLRASLPANVELVSRLAPDCPSVLGDRTQLHQILMNLGTNAWHAMGAQGGRIEIALQGVSIGELPVVPAPSVIPAQAGIQMPANGIHLPAGLYVHLSVKDNGKGMDAATLARIFDPFFTTKAPGEGTGLGLSVVDGIVKGHGGAITCYSQVGVGSTFHLYLPAQQPDGAQVAQAQSQNQAQAQAQAQASKGKGQRILFLDDEEALVLLSTRLLERLGYEVKAYSDSAEALAAFKADPSGFDLLVTDFNMPGPSGLDVAGQMLKIRPDLPVALASGYVSDELREKAAALGIKEVLYKPTAVEGLVEAIDRMLGAAR